MLEEKWGHLAFIFSLAAHKAKRIKQYSVASKFAFAEQGKFFIFGESYYSVKIGFYCGFYYYYYFL